MAFTYEDVIPSNIENTTMKKAYDNGNFVSYRITPIEGYVLHDKARDYTDMNPDTMEETFKLGYTTATASCGANYDFTANPREFYAVPADSVPADQIFGSGGNHKTVW